MKAMLDIETLATTPRAVVVSIGAVLFEILPNSNNNPPDVSFTHVFYELPDIAMQLAAGRTIDPKTLAWWQEPAQRKGMQAWTSFGLARGPQLVLQDLSKWLSKYTVDEIWANGADFDFPIIRSLFDDFCVPVPWPYNAVRDARTVYRICPQRRATVKEDYIEHHAVGDCKRQIIKLWEHWPND